MNPYPLETLDCSVRDAWRFVGTGPAVGARPTLTTLQYDSLSNHTLQVLVEDLEALGDRVSSDLYDVEYSVRIGEPSLHFCRDLIRMGSMLTSHHSVFHRS
jgi:hypothetical protein